MQKLNLYKGFEKLIKRTKENNPNISGEELKKKLLALGLAPIILTSGIAIGCNDVEPVEIVEEEEKEQEEKEQEEQEEQEASFRDFYSSFSPGLIQNFNFENFVDEEVMKFLHEERFISQRNGNEIFWDDLKEEHGILYMFAAMSHVEGELLEKLLIHYHARTVLYLNTYTFGFGEDTLSALLSDKVVFDITKNTDSVMYENYRGQELYNAIERELIDGRGRHPDFIGYGNYLGLKMHQARSLPITSGGGVIWSDITENRKRLVAAQGLTRLMLSAEAVEVLGLETADLLTYGPVSLEDRFSNLDEYNFEEYEKEKQR